MTIRSVLAFGAVVAIALIGAVAFNSIDRRADETTKVPNVVLPTGTAEGLATQLPTPVLPVESSKTPDLGPPPAPQRMPDIVYPTEPPQRRP